MLLKTCNIAAQNNFLPHGQITPAFPWIFLLLIAPLCVDGLPLTSYCDSTYQNQRMKSIDGRIGCLLGFQDAEMNADMKQQCVRLPTSDQLSIKNCSSFAPGSVIFSGNDDVSAVVLSLDQQFLRLQPSKTVTSMLRCAGLNDLAKVYTLNSTQSWIELQQPLLSNSEAQLVSQHDLKILKTAYLDAIAYHAKRPVSIFILQNIWPKINSYDVVDGLEPRHVNSFFSSSSLELPVISLVTKNNKFDQDNSGLCFLVARKLESEFRRHRDLWARLQSLYDQNSENKLGSLVNCFSREFSKELIGDIQSYDYSLATFETVFNFMKPEIPDALANPIISNFLWMKRYSYDFYLKNVARPSVITHVSPSVFLYELKVIRYTDLEQTFVPAVLNNPDVCPIVLDMLFIKLHSDYPGMDMRSSRTVVPDVAQVVPFLSVLGTRALASKGSSYWEKLSEVLINNMQLLRTTQEFDLARLIFEKVEQLLVKQKSLEPKQLIPIAKGIPNSFFQSGEINDVEIDFLLQEDALNVAELPVPALHALLQRGPINRGSLESFITKQQCYKFSVLSNIWYSEFIDLVKADHSQLYFDKTERSLIESCKLNLNELSPLDYAIRLRSFMKANTWFQINARSVKLLENALSGILIKDIFELPAFDSLDVIYLITSNTDSSKSDKQLARALASRALEVVSQLSLSQFKISKVTWKTIPQFYLGYFSSYMLRELPPVFFEGKPESKLDTRRCIDIVNKIGYSQHMKSSFSLRKSEFLTNFYLQCVSKREISAETLINMGSLVCNLPASDIRKISPVVLKGYGYLFNDCCLSKQQGKALYSVVVKTEMSFDDLHFSFGAALPVIINFDDKIDVLANYIATEQRKRVYYEQIASLLSRATNLLYSNESFCRAKLRSYDLEHFENSVKILFNVTFDRLRSLTVFKPYISSVHDDSYDRSPSCAMIKTFGESLRYADSSQVSYISDYDFQNCILHISKLKFLKDSQKKYFSMKLESLKKNDQIIKQMGNLATFPRDSDELNVLSTINFTDYDEVSLHSYLPTWSNQQLSFGLQLFKKQNRIQSLHDLTSIQIVTLGNFLCAADFEELLNNPGLSYETLKFSLPWMSKLSLCGHDQMRSLKSKLQETGFVMQSKRLLTEFDINDYGFILSGFTARELNELVSEKPFVLQYADKPFFLNLPESELVLLSCEFWQVIQPTLLQQLPQNKLAILSDDTIGCVLKNINSGLLSEEDVEKSRGTFDEPKEDSLFVTHVDTSTSKVASNSNNMLTKDEGTEDYYERNVRVTYIVVSGANLFVCNSSAFLFLLFLTQRLNL